MQCKLCLLCGLPYDLKRFYSKKFILKYRVGDEKVARLPFAFAFAFGYCINFCMYAMLRTPGYHEKVARGP
jgi:hypothetical protein